MKILAIIPARSGSKRLKGKNMRILNGESLVNRAIRIAKKHPLIDDIVLTTDIKELYKLKDIKIIKRNWALCRDETKMIPVIKDVITKYPDYDAYVLLQPTSPLRKPEHITRAIKSLGDKFNTVVSVDPEKAHNGTVYVIKKGYLHELNDYKKTYEYVMDEKQVDIDTIDDFNKAERILDERM